jgi:hypothetical protein
VEDIVMKKNIMKLILLVLPILLLVTDAGFAAKGKKAERVKTDATTENQEKAPPTSQAPASPATGEEINWQVISSGGTEGMSTNFVLKGTLGQTAVGFGSSASYGLSHGFWQEFGAATCCNHDGIRGDADGSGSINVNDPTYLTNWIFFGGPDPPCIDPDGTMPEADADGSGSINVADPTYLTDYIFFGGPEPLPCP